MSKIVVITGAGAGVGRAVVTEFARNGWDVALLSRDPARLEDAAREVRHRGNRALPIPTDVADAEAVEAAATRVEAELGPIDVWVNVAMATVFSPVAKLTAEEVARGTAVTYLGQVHGMMAALKRMTPRNRGAIVNVGSALAYRSVPLQSVYCGAKFAIRGFTDSLRSEILHDKLNISLSMVDLPAVNTPQFDWALNKTGHRARPVPPVFQPEVPARAIYFAACHPSAANLDRLPHCQGHPGQPHRSRPDRPLPRQRRLFRPDGPGIVAAQRAQQSVPSRAGPIRRARPVRRTIPQLELGSLHQPPPHGYVGNHRRRRSLRPASLGQAPGHLANRRRLSP